MGSGVDVKFLVDAAAIGVDGVVADSEFACDFFAEIALSEEAEDLFFALGELAEFVFFACRSGGPEAFDDFSGDATAHGRPAFVDFAEG